MSERSGRALLGAALLAASLAGFALEVRRFDRTATFRERAATAQPAWSPAYLAPALLLGQFPLPVDGVVRASACPPGGADPHATLRVVVAGGRVRGEAPLRADPGRGQRCYSAEVRGAGAELAVAALVLPAAAPSAPVPALGDVHAEGARRITPFDALPVAALVAGLALLLVPGRSRRGATIDPPQDPPVALVDGAATGPLAVLAYLATIVVTGVLGGIYLSVRGHASTAVYAGGFNAAALLAQHGLLVLVALLFLGAHRTTRWGVVLGLAPLERRTAARAVVLAAVLLGIAAVSTLAIRDAGASPMGKLLEHTPARYAVAFGALLAPFSEELFFRGVLVRAFARYGRIVALVVPAAVFTAAHAMQLQGAWAGLLPIASLALVNGWLRLASGGLTQPWLVHTLYNGALSLSLYLDARGG